MIYVTKRRGELEELARKMRSTKKVDLTTTQKRIKIRLSMAFWVILGLPI